MASTLLEVIILICVVVMTVHGYFKGFVKKVLSIAALIIALIVAFVLTPPMTKALHNTELYTNINDSIQKIVDEKVQAEIGEMVSDNTNIIIEDSKELIDKIEMPSVVHKVIIDTIDNVEDEQLDTQSFSSVISRSLTDYILRMAVFGILFAAVMIICRIILVVIDAVMKLPVLNTLNKTAGAILGLAESVLVILVLLLLVNLISVAIGNTTIVEIIENTHVLNIVYENNILEHIVIK